MKLQTAEWVAKAEGDWNAAQQLNRVRKNPNYDGVCFHCQQCAEKYLKARLIEAGIAFARTHDLPFCTKESAAGISLRAIAAEERIAFLADFARQLN